MKMVTIRGFILIILAALAHMSVQNPTHRQKRSSHSGTSPPGPSPPGGPGGPGDMSPGTHHDPPGPMPEPGGPRAPGSSPSGGHADQPHRHDNTPDKESAGAAAMMEMLVDYLNGKEGPEIAEAIGKANAHMGDMQGDAAINMKELSDEQKMEVFEHYAREHIERNLPEPFGKLSKDEELTATMQNYLNDDKQIEDLRMYGVRQELFAAANEFIQDGNIHLMEVHIRSQVRKMEELTKPKTPKRMILRALVKHVWQDLPNVPDEQIQKMLMHAISGASKEDHRDVAYTFQMILFLRDASEEQKEFAKKVLDRIMTDNKVLPKKVMGAMLTHYTLIKHYNKNDVMAAHLINSLYDIGDDESRKMAGALVSHIITGNRMMRDMPEAEKWKWSMPMICRMERPGQVTYPTACPKDMQCSIESQNNIRINNQDYKVSICAIPTHYLMFHTCRLNYLNGTIKRETSCKMGDCDVGPFRLPWNEEDMNVELNARYCRDIVNTGRTQTIVDRACAVTDEQNYNLMQRPCPKEHGCWVGPFPAMWTDGEMKHAWTCMKDDNKDSVKRLIEIMINDDDQSKKAMGPDGMPGEGSNGMSGSVNNSMPHPKDKQFIEFVVSFIEESTKKGNDDVKQDPDAVGVLILQHFITNMMDMKGHTGLAGKTYEVLSKRKASGHFSDQDRKVMQMLISNFMQRNKAMKEEQERRKGGMGMDGDRMDTSMDMMNMLMDMMKGQQMNSGEKDRDDDEKKGDKMGMNIEIMKMMLSLMSQKENRERPPSNRDGDSKDADEQKKRNMEMMEMFLRLMQQHNDGGRKDPPPPPPPQDMMSMLMRLLMEQMQQQPRDEEKQDKGQGPAREQDKVLRDLAELVIHHASDHGDQKDELMQRMRGFIEDGNKDKQQEDMMDMLMEMMHHKEDK